MSCFTGEAVQLEDFEIPSFAERLFADSADVEASEVEPFESTGDDIEAGLEGVGDQATAVEKNRAPGVRADFDESDLFPRRGNLEEAIGEPGHVGASHADRARVVQNELLETFLSVTDH